MINSHANAQIRELAKLLKNAKYRRQQKLFVAEGRKLFEEAVKLGLVRKTFVSELLLQAMQGGEPDYLRGITYETVSGTVFRQISDVVAPQGIMAVVAQPEYTLPDLLANRKANLVFLEDVQDPGNLGTLIRTGEGAGVNGFVMSRNTADLFNPKVVRSTMGSIFRMPFVYVDNFIESLEMARQSGICLFAADLNADMEYDGADFSKRCGIMIGNEGNGLSAEAVSHSDYKIKIPMDGQSESLNAAVSGAILMYEARRQRHCGNSN